MTTISENLRKIRDQGALGLVHDIFVHSAELRTQTGRVYGRDDISSSLAAELAAFSHQRVLATQEVLDQSGLAWAASVKAKHTGVSLLGPATDRPVTYASIEIHRLAAGRIRDGWQVVDTSHILRQLGVSPDAAALAEQMLGNGFVGWALGEIRPGLGQMAPPRKGPIPKRIDCAADAVIALDYIWNHRRLDLLDTLYSKRIQAHWPDGQRFTVADSIRRSVLALLAAVPDATLLVEHSVMGDKSCGIVWRLLGHHTGPGFGMAPSGVRVKVQGVSIYRMAQGRIVKEWTLFDEIGVRAQILASSRRRDLGPFKSEKD